MVNYSSAAALDATFSALSDPTRRAMLARLARHDASVGQLARPFEMSLPAVSKHLRVLHHAGLVAREKHGRVHRLSLVPGPLEEAQAWIDRYRRFWQQQLDALADYLNDSQEKERFRWPKKNKTPTRVSRSAGPSPRRGKKSSRRGPTRRK
ncbi:MAG TPA: metalloregulator ArsR/SmtB family transcription factor [Candidatus Binatia bacterium]|jgi:DNA-binding transcriptional ArsR family regulator